MTFVGSSMGLASPSSGLRFSSSRGRIQGGQQGVNYPSPFFDIAHTYLPTTVKQMFKWCRYYFLTNPLINAVVFKLSEYPVTDLLIEHADEEVKKLWTEYMQDHLRYRAFQVEVGLDYHTYGNALVGISFPFVKYLTCSTCGFKEQAKRIRHRWSFNNYTFRLTCPSCGNTGPAKVKDFYVKNPSGIKLIRWNPEDVDIEYNPISGEYTHYYNIPAPTKNDIVVGKKDVVEGIPQIFIEALRRKKSIIFSGDMMFHMKRASIATQDRGWGVPLLLPVLKDAFYMQLMKKAQEAILLEHIIPLRVLFPQGNGTADPYTTVNLDQWRDHVAQEIARWRYDHNYFPIMPLPIGQQTIGGDGRALLLTQEMQMHNETILNGMQVPREFIMGGLSYAGTNVSLRMMENSFLGYILYHKHMTRFVMQQIAAFLEWPLPTHRFKPFKMADDLQRLALYFQLNQAQKMSDTTLLSQCDLSQKEEDRLMHEETSSRLAATEKQQLAMADIQGKSQMIMTKYQMKAQMVAQAESMQPQAPGEPGAGQPGPGDVAQQQQEQMMMQQQQAQMDMAGQNMAQQQQMARDISAQQEQQQAQGGMPPEAQSPLNGGQQMAAQPGGVQMDMQAWALMQAQAIAQMDPQQQQMALQNIQAQSPELAELILQMLNQMQPQVGAMDSGVDMRPLPDQLPPRRESPIV